jgi:two-component system cell cycle response regulator
VRVTFAGDVTEAANFAQENDCDMVFASLDLKSEDGLRICPLLRTRETTRQLPILLIANDSEMPRVARGLDIGASDYLLRPIDANELLARTRTQLRQKRHYQLIRSSYERNMELALVDPLTGAFNRRYLEAHIPKLLARCRSIRKPLGVIMIDLDHFKHVNDAHGHAVGDAVLKEAVNRITLSLRPSDLVARLGGEEFAVIMPEADLAAVLSIAERLRRRISDTPVDASGQALPITMSLGATATPPEDTEDWQAIFKRADEALYEAKNSGRNCVIGKNKEN